MTRNDYWVIVNAIRELEFSHEEPGTEGSTRRYVAEVFVDHLSTDNPRFKPDLFVKACMGEVERGYGYRQTL